MKLPNLVPAIITRAQSYNNNLAHDIFRELILAEKVKVTKIS